MITDHPYFWILEANPERYIKKPSVTAVVIIKAFEAFVAVILSVRFFALLLFAFTQGGGNGVISLSALLEMIFPEQFISAVTFGGDTAVLYNFNGEGLEVTLAIILAVIIMILLICTIIEAVSLLFLRLCMNGAGVVKNTHKAIFFSTLAMLFTVIGLAALMFYRFATFTLWQNPLASIKNVTPMIIIVTLIIVLIGFRLRYHKGVITVFTTIQYELNMGYKETAMPHIEMSKYFLLFGVVCGATAGIISACSCCLASNAFL